MGVAAAAAFLWLLCVSVVPFPGAGSDTAHTTTAACLMWVLLGHTHRRLCTHSQPRHLSVLLKSTWTAVGWGWFWDRVSMRPSRSPVQLQDCAWWGLCVCFEGGGGGHSGSSLLLCLGCAQLVLLDALVIVVAALQWCSPPTPLSTCTTCTSMTCWSQDCQPMTASAVTLHPHVVVACCLCPCDRQVSDGGCTVPPVSKPRMTRCTIE